MSKVIEKSKPYTSIIKLSSETEKKLKDIKDLRKSKGFDTYMIKDILSEIVEDNIDKYLATSEISFANKQIEEANAIIARIEKQLIDHRKRMNKLRTHGSEA